MLVNSDTLAAIRTNARAVFMTALGDLRANIGDWQDIATVFNSDTEKESYNWLGAAPPMQEWKDKRKLNGLRPFDYTLTNKDWEATLEVERNAIKDNKLGHIPIRVRSLARSYLKFINEYMFSLLDDGESIAAYDGSYFFHDTRKIGDSGTIDNILSGSYSDSASEIRAGISAAVVQMASFCDDWGKKMNLVPDTIVCSPAMYMLIKEALKSDYSGQARTEAEFVKKIISSPWIDADTDDWFVLCTTEEVKPLIFQNRQNPEFNQVDNPSDSHVFLNKTFLYGIDARFERGFGDPRTAILIHNT
ncbi:MAG: Mu-like prophage major head subunit gpT family protein [Dehalococcoidales bacterium]|nr:Mu-like prophage major head subunit gpT family protein [Dehalococcoidales bacterium]